MPARGRGNGYQGSKWARRDLRLAVYLRDGMACSYCGASLEDGATLSLDHIEPHSAGGSNHPSNLTTACKTCNSSRADRPLEEFTLAVVMYLDLGPFEDHLVSGGHLARNIRERAAQDIHTFRQEAKTLLARRAGWQAALEHASQEVAR